MIHPESIEELISDHGKGYAVVINKDGVEISDRVRFRFNDGVTIKLGPITEPACGWQALTLTGRIAIDGSYDPPMGKAGDTLSWNGGWRLE